MRMCDNLFATLLILCAVALARSAPLLPGDNASNGQTSDPGPRGDKALEYFQYLLPPFAANDADLQRGQEARAEPLYQDSPIYYIRLPPSPYVYVPGLGYVSQPARRPAAPAVSPFVNLPVDFLANGKPSAIYQWPSPADAGDYQQQFAPATTPPPPKTPSQSSVVHLDKGPYVFNGRPSDIYVLRDSYNSLYADALQNFYP